MRVIIHSSIAFKVLAYVLYFYVPNPNVIFISRCLAGIAYGADGAVVGQVSRSDEIFLDNDTAVIKLVDIMSSVH